MLKKIFPVLFALSVLLPAINARASEMPGGKWWHRPQVAKTLNLTDQEKQVLNEKFAFSKRKRIDLKANVQKARLDLDLQLANQPLDEKALLKQFDKVLSARNALAKEQFAFIMEVRKVLGQDRFEQLKNQFQDLKRHRKKGRYGRKGHGGKGHGMGQSKSDTGSW